MNWKAAIPNSLTLGNLLCGCLGIIATFEDSMLTASVLIGIAAVFDFFDGLAARLLGVSGELGKQLDSLADVVTFGVLPGIMMFHWISIGLGDYFTPFFEREFSHQAAAVAGLSVALFSALRLAIFNIDTRQADSFIGVPTPASAILIASFPLIMQVQYGLNFYNPVTSDGMLSALINLNYWRAWEFHIVLLLWDPRFHISASLVLSLLLVAPFPLLNFKFKNFTWADNKHRYIFSGSALALIVLTALPYIPYIRRLGLPFLDFTIIPLIILLYILYSLLLYIIKTRRNEI